MKTALFFLLTLSLYPLECALADPRSNPRVTTHYSLDDVERMIRTTSPRSIEETLLKLPPDFRRNPVLMKESRSIQYASSQAPRVIFSNSDSSFLMSFAGEITSSGGDQLELIQFHRSTSRFEFATVTYADGRPTLNRDVKSCAGCHGSSEDPRPNWESFPAWPGAYGENEERLNAYEQSELLSFSAQAKHHPRYRSMIDLEKTHLTFDSEGKIAGHANSTLNQNLNRLNAMRIGRLVRANSNYRSEKLSILATLVCPLNDATKFSHRYFPNRPLSEIPAQLNPLEAGSTRNGVAAFFWAALPRTSKMFFWTLSFGDQYNTAPVRTAGVASQDYIHALVSEDPELSRALPTLCD